jgi:iron complex transport system permease protein
MNKALLPLLVFLALLVFMLSISFGSLSIPLKDVLQALLTADNSINSRIIWQLRLPHAVFAFIVGGLLALAGALMQALLRNPLADPYVLGTSGGAATGVLLAFLFSLNSSLHPLAALVGALISTLLLVTFSGISSGLKQNKLLLTGIVLTTGWGALITFILTVAPLEQIPGMLFWLIGDLNENEILLVPALTLFLSLMFVMFFTKTLDILLLGDIYATSLGVNVTQSRLLLLGIAIVTTSIAVTWAGPIGFIGLVTPHIVRLIAGSTHRMLLPASVLLGGSLLMGADILARTLIGPRQIPVGVFTALLGVPVFLFLIRRQK